jgi:DNA-binding LacI/PurR family transcriptional regulator
MPEGDRPVTMTDVARAAGVSQSTVSRVLSGADVAIAVTDATRERVLRLAREMGYRPHPFARALRGAPTMLIGAIVRDITDVFFARAIDALSLEARARGYSLVLGNARAQAGEALALAAVLEARQCDAILLLGDFHDEEQLVRDVRAAPVPVVALWHGRRARDSFATVAVDNGAGVEAAMAHLAALGHRRIAFAGGDPVGDVRERHAAWQRLAPDAPPGYTETGTNALEWGAEALRRLLALPEPPTAVLAGTDVVAIGILHGAHELGLRVPDAVSVVGFDDIALAAASVPALTTVRMPVAEMVTAALDLVLAGGTDEPPLPFVPELVVRASTARPASG